MRGWSGQLIRYARPFTRTLLVIALLMLGGIVLQLLAPWPLKLIVDYVLTGEPLPLYAAWMAQLPGAAEARGQIAWLAGAALLLYLAAQTAGTAQEYLKIGAGQRMMYNLGADLFAHLQRLSLRFHGRRPSGDLVKRITRDASAVKSLVFSTLLPAVTALATLIAMFYIMWRLDWILTLVAVASVPLLAVLMRVLYGPMMARSYAEHEAEGALISHAEQVLSGIPAVQAFGRESIEEQRFRSLSGRYVSASLKTLASQLQFKVGVGAVTAAGTAMIIGVGGWRVLEGELLLGSLLVFIAYLAMLYGPIETFAYMSSSHAFAAASARRVLELMDSDAQVPDPDKPVLFPAAPGTRVEYRNVTAGYEPGRPVIRNVSFVAQPTQTVALTGRSGSGKTTLMNLLLRFIDPWEGTILVNGVDIRRIGIADLRRNIGIVLQEPLLLPISIAENIAYGRLEASFDDVVRAAEAARAHEFIVRLPEGYDTVVGERGATLSLGQRQRISIARALLKDPPILILDEPSSALDAETEALLMAGIERLKEGRTTFIIAHRPTLSRRADAVINVVRAGEQVQTE